MRSFITFVLSLVLVIAAVNLLRDNVRYQAAWSRMTVPFQLLRLQTQPADRVIAMPVRGVYVNRVANTWGAPRPGDRKHQGQDIFARRGTPVLAAAEGIITRIGENGLGGKSIFVTGRGGRTYYYAHLCAYNEELSPGDFVNHDTILGYVGNTGNARTTPPHLHFAIYGPTGAVDPLPLLVDRSVPRDSANVRRG